MTQLPSALPQSCSGTYLAGVGGTLGLRLALGARGLGDGVEGCLHVACRSCLTRAVKYSEGKNTLQYATILKARLMK